MLLVDEIVQAGVSFYDRASVPLIEKFCGYPHFSSIE